MAIRYKSDLAQERWDSILIGSGIGSLTTAVLLARAGQRVLVLERHYEPGGFTHTFKRKGFEWDVGVHYIGMVHKPGSVKRRLFDHLCDGRQDWADMGSPYDRAVLDGEVYDFVADPREQLALWERYFPKDATAIRRYWELVRQAQRTTNTFFAERALPRMVSMPLGRLMTRGFHKFSDRTTYEVLRELTDNERLITLLCAQCGDYGLVPKESSFAIHAMVVHHYRHGGAYPVGGARRMHEHIINVIEANGGTVAVKAPVAEILVRNGRAMGVRMENGDEILARRVISGAGANTTFARLLSAEHVPDQIRTDLQRVRRSLGHLGLYVGLDASDAALGLPKYNYWVYENTASHAPGTHMTDAYISFPSAKDPAWATEHPDKATVQIIAPMRYDDVAGWMDTRWRRRPEDYDAYKAEVEARMLDQLYLMVPSTRGHVAYSEVSTPLSTRHFANYDHGQIYGLEHTPERFRLKWLRPRTHLKDFYLTGQDICSAGIFGALFSGILTASAVLGKNVMGGMMRENSEV
jgi:all-trans-retinol 13,14-reductase